MIDIGGILGAGIRLTRERPVAVAVWVLINVVFVAASQIAMVPMMQLITQPFGARPDPETMLAAMVPFYGVILVMAIAQIVVWAAIYRACLRPDESAAAYLRIGGDEWRLFLIGLLWVLFSTVVLVIGGLIIGAGIAGVRAGAPGSAGPTVAVVLAGFGLGLFLLILFIFLGVRLALVWPLAMQRKRILIGEAWRLSRGHFWAMFGSALAVLLILYAASMVVNVLQFGSFGVPGMGAADPETARRMMFTQFTTFGPMRIIVILLSGVVGAGYMIAMAAGLAEALHQLQPDDSDSLAEIYA